MTWIGRKRRLVAGGPVTIDPSTLNLTGYWDGNYDNTIGNKWTGLPSAGSSAGRHMFTGLGPIPNESAPIGGIDVIDFLTYRELTTGLSVVDFFGPYQLVIGTLFKPSASPGALDPANPVASQELFASGLTYIRMGKHSDGVVRVAFSCWTASGFRTVVAVLPPTSQWMFVVCVVDTTEQQIWVNGALAASISTVAQVFALSGVARTNANFYGNCFHERQMTFFAQAITPAEILGVYNFLKANRPGLSLP